MKTRAIAAAVSILAIGISIACFSHETSLNNWNALNNKVKTATIAPQAISTPKAIADFGKIPLSFEENRGQTDSAVKFLSRGPGYGVFLTKDATVLKLADKASTGSEGRSSKSRQTKSTVVQMKLVGANPNAEIAGEQELPGRVNYLQSTAEKTKTDIATYARVRYREAYPGVDVVFYGNQRELEYDLVLAPGVDPSSIRMRYEGASKLSVDKAGNLVIAAGSEHIRQKKPVVYQELKGERKLLAGNYVVEGGNDVAFHIGNYDRSQRLVIDPVLVYGTFLSGSYWDSANGVATDAAGNTYVVGTALSPDFPVTTGAFKTEPTKVCNDFSHEHWIPVVCIEEPFVSKLNPAGTALIYSTYLGPDFGTLGDAIAVDESGNAYIGGTGSVPKISSTDSPRFEAGCKWGNNGSAYVLKLNAAGSAVLNSVCLGGHAQNKLDDVEAIVLGPNGNVYIAGHTTSGRMPTTTAAVQPAFGGGRPLWPGDGDVFLAKLNSALDSLFFCTYLGGDAEDRLGGFAVDSAGDAYVAGTTFSDNFPHTKVFGTGSGGKGFLTKINGSGTNIIYSNLITSGPSGNLEWVGVRGLAVDSDRNAYISGFAPLTGFPTTPGALQSKDDWVAFVTKFDPSGGSLVYSATFGGKHYGSGNWIAVNAKGEAYTTVEANLDFLTTPDALEKTPTLSAVPTPGSVYIDGGQFIVKLNSDASAIKYSSFMGGVSSFYGMMLDNRENLYLTGVNYLQTPLVVTPNAFQRTPFPFTGESFVAKFSFADAVPPPPTPVSADFFVTAAPSAQNVNRGQSANFALTVTPNESQLKDPVTFSCSGLPSQAACAFSPSSLTLSGNPATTNLTITTSATSALLNPARNNAGGLLALTLSTAIFGFVWTMVPVLKPSRKRISVVSLAVVLVVGAQIGCRGIVTPPSETAPAAATTSASPPPATQAKTFTVMVTATSGSVQHSVPLSLTLQ